jgi:transcriptional regulator with XRE-family HTH domain
MSSAIICLSYKLAKLEDKFLNHDIDIQKLIRELRKRTGLSQEKFAAKLGVTFPTINRWENGRAKPSPLAMQRIEDFLQNLGDNGKDLIQEYLIRKESGFD